MRNLQLNTADILRLTGINRTTLFRWEKKLFPTQAGEEATVNRKGSPRGGRHGERCYSAQQAWAIAQKALNSAYHNAAVINQSLVDMAEIERQIIFLKAYLGVDETGLLDWENQKLSPSDFPLLIEVLKVCKPATRETERVLKLCLQANQSTNPTPDL